MSANRVAEIWLSLCVEASLLQRVVYALANAHIVGLVRFLEFIWHAVLAEFNS